MECSEGHNEHLTEYLRFMRRGRDTAIAEVSAEFVEIKENRLFEEDYGLDEVHVCCSTYLLMSAMHLASGKPQRPRSSRECRP